MKDYTDYLQTVDFYGEFIDFDANYEYRDEFMLAKSYAEYVEEWC